MKPGYDHARGTSAALPPQLQVGIAPPASHCPPGLMVLLLCVAVRVVLAGAKR
jgi:hypothetical protein